MFRHPDGLFDVDVFYDLLSFSHEVWFRDSVDGDRLELDFPTIPLADIVLEKLQIHRINRKDLVDLFMLLSGHEILPAAGPDPEAELRAGGHPSAPGARPAAAEMYVHHPTAIAPTAPASTRSRSRASPTTTASTFIWASGN